MKFLRKLLQPKYLAGFSCIGIRCEQSCCQDWRITIDHDACEKFRNCPDPELKLLLDKKMIPTEHGFCSQNVASMKIIHSLCPFLAADQLCTIQHRLGEQYLPRTCAEFPRRMNVVNDTLEKSLDMACPEAVRLALLSPEPMQWESLEPDIQWSVPAGDMPTLDPFDDRYPHKPFRYFLEIRILILALVQNRDFSLGERLHFLGHLCREIGQVFAESGDCKIPGLLETFSRKIVQGSLGEVGETLSQATPTVVKLLAGLLAHFVKSESVIPSFMGCYEEFRQGILYTPESSSDELGIRFSEAYSRHFKPFLIRHEFILENYLGNYIFQTLFPFGPQKCTFQKSIHQIPRSIDTAYALLVVQFALIQMLLVGMAGHHQEHFGIDHVVRLIHAYSKNIEHNHPFLQRVLQLFEENGFLEPRFLGKLIPFCTWEIGVRPREFTDGHSKFFG